MLSRTGNNKKSATNAVWHRQYRCSGIKYCENAASLIFGDYEVFNRVDPELFTSVSLNEGKAYIHSSISDLDKKIRENTQQ